MRLSLLLGILGVFLPMGLAVAQEAVSVRALTDRVVVVQVLDGRVQSETLGSGIDGKVIEKPLDVKNITSAKAYQITDTTSSKTFQPSRVGRKSKGTDFARIAEWEIGHTKTHWIYLIFNQPLQRGRQYELKAPFAERRRFTYNDLKNRSEAVQVNQVGFRPDTKKFAYLSHWMGSAGGLDLKPYAKRSFHLVDVESGENVFSGKPKPHHRADEVDDKFQVNYRKADLWELDFSAFKKPGAYRVVMEGVGSSFPFEIRADIYRQVFQTVMHGLYHQRCGVTLDEAQSKWPRPRCHHPDDRTIKQSKYRITDKGAHFEELPKQATDEVVHAWGGYHDAGDWDRRAIHLSVTDMLLYIFDASPAQFPDDELSIPESGNGLPDIIDEARFNLDLYRRLQKEHGGVCGGLESEEHPKFGEASWTDSHPLYAFAPDTQSTYRYAASAAHMSRIMKMLERKEESDVYLKSSLAAWKWAGEQEDARAQRDHRLHAAAALYRLTGDEDYHDQFLRDLRIETSETPLYDYGHYDQRWGVWTYLATEGLPLDQRVATKLRYAAIHEAEILMLKTAAQRGRRLGYDWYRPFGHGSLTTPDNLPLIAAHRITGEQRFIDQMAFNADVALGGNALNVCWVTGLGDRPVRQVLHVDSWFDEILAPIPGIVPYGPMRHLDNPSWTHAWGPQSLWPPSKEWPWEEQWTGNRLSPVAAEYTVHENIGPAAAAYAYLAVVR